MILWLIFALMTLAAVFAVCWPLVRRQTAVRSGSDVEVYRDQLDEIGRDQAASRIGRVEAEAARVEVSRRLIAAAETAQAASAASAPVPSGRTRFATLAAAARMTPDERKAMIESMVARLAQRMAGNGSDVDGWLRLIRAYSMLGERDKALSATANARSALAGQDDKLRRIAELTKELGLEGS